MKTLLSLSMFSLLTAWSAAAQSFSLGSDLASRYVWRGSDFGESMSIQPYLSFDKGGFSIGSWASYSMSADGAGANEHDLFVTYTVESEKSGSFTVGVTDYYFPAPSGLGFFEFDGEGEGAHWIEPFVGWEGPASFPVSLMGAAFVHNDPDRSVYLEASVPQTLDDVELSWTVGAVTGESVFYGTTSFSVVHAGVSVTRNVELTEQFSLPLTVSYIINPVAERTFLVFGLSF